MNAQRKLILSLCIAILLFLTVGYLGIGPGATDYPAYLSFSPDRDGTKAFKLLLEQKGKAAKEWRQSWRFLPQGSQQALVVIEPDQLQPGEQEPLMAWVEQGNALFLFQSDPLDWEQFATEETGDADSYWRYVERVEPEAETKEKAVVETINRLVAVRGQKTLLQDQTGILAAQTDVGAGQITLFLTPEWLQNENIAEYNHFELIWPYLQKEYEAIWFDEFHHGYQEQPGLLAVYPEWLLFFTVQFSIAALLWIWWKGKRFGPVYTLREWVVRRGDETILAVAGWYERRRLAKEACRHQEAYLRRLFQQKWGLPAHASTREIVSMARMRWDDKSATRVEGLLRRLQEVEKGKRYSGKELLQDSRWIDEITNRLEKE